MKHLFTDDPQIINKELSSLIESGGHLICGRGGTKNFKKLALKGKVKSAVGELMVIDHPHEPTCSSQTCLFYYHTKENHLRCFETERIKKSNNLLVLKYPAVIYSIHRRAHSRVTTAGNSRVTYSLLNKQRVHYGKVADISLEGAKLLVDIPSVMSVGDLLCHLTFTLCSRYPFVDETQVHIPEAKVMWLRGDADHTHTLGVKFLLHESSQASLDYYIELRTIEDPNSSS
jgi:hypothetical protein